MKKVFLVITLIFVLSIGAWAGPNITSVPTPLATSAETITGTDSAKAVTPAGLKSSLTNTGYDVGVGSSAAGKNFTVNATLGNEMAPALVGASWTLGYNTGGWAIADGVLTKTASTGSVTATPSGTFAVTAGRSYFVSVNITALSGTLTVTLGDALYSTTSTGVLERYFIAGSTGKLILSGTASVTATITSISVKELTPATGDATIQGKLYVKSQIIPAIHSSMYPAYALDNGAVGLKSGMGYLYGSTGYGYFSYNSIIAAYFAASSFTFPVGNTFGFDADSRFYRPSANNVHLRNGTTQQNFFITNTWTDTSNYEGQLLTGIAGAWIGRKASTAGTGGDNLDVLDTPAGTGGVGIRPPTEATGGGLVTRVSNGSATLSGASTSITLSPVIPTGSRIRSTQFRVNTAITSGDGAATWTAAYTNTPTTAIGSGFAFTLNTKVNKIHPAHELTTDAVAVAITPNSGTFSGGVVEVFVYYEDNVALSNAP